MGVIQIHQINHAMFSLPVMHQWWIDCRAPGKYWDHWSAAKRPLVGPHEGERSLVVARERQRLSILHFSEKRHDIVTTY